MVWKSSHRNIVISTTRNKTRSSGVAIAWGFFAGISYLGIWRWESLELLHRNSWMNPFQVCLSSHLKNNPCWVHPLTRQIPLGAILSSIVNWWVNWSRFMAAFVTQMTSLTVSSNTFFMSDSELLWKNFYKSFVRHWQCKNTNWILQKVRVKFSLSGVLSRKLESEGSIAI